MPWLPVVPTRPVSSFSSALGPASMTNRAGRLAAPTNICHRPFQIDPGVAQRPPTPSQATRRAHDRIISGRGRGRRVARSRRRQAAGPSLRRRP